MSRFWSQGDLCYFIQEKYFTVEDEINFDLNEFLDFNKVPGLDESTEDLAALQAGPAVEPDLT